MQSLTLKPTTRVNGIVQLPGSKSLSNRLLLLSSLAEGRTEVNNLLESDDTGYMTAALESLGVGLTFSDNGMRVPGGKQGRALCGAAGGTFPGQRGYGHTPSVRDAMRRGRRIHPYRRTPDVGTPYRSSRGCFEAVGGGNRVRRCGRIPPFENTGRWASWRAGFHSWECLQPIPDGVAAGLSLTQDELEIQIIGDLVSKPYIDMTVERDATVWRSGGKRRIPGLPGGRGTGLPNHRAPHWWKATLPRPAFPICGGDPAAERYASTASGLIASRETSSTPTCSSRWEQ